MGPGSRVVTQPNPFFVLQIPSVALRESCLRVSHGYKAYAKLGWGATRQTMVLSETDIAFGIVFLKASFMEIYWLKWKYRKK